MMRLNVAAARKRIHPSSSSESTSNSPSVSRIEYLNAPGYVSAIYSSSGYVLLKEWKASAKPVMLIIVTIMKGTRPLKTSESI